MKSLRSYLSLSTAFVMFTITPSFHCLAGGSHQEEGDGSCTKCTHHEKSVAQEGKSTTSPHKKAAMRSHRHHCPFCDQDGNSVWGYLEREATHGLQEMEKTFQNLNAMLQQSRDAGTLAEGEAEECARYSLQEFTPKEKGHYGIKISLPGFKQDDLAVTVNTKQKYGKKSYNVEIVAKKQEKSTKKETPEESNETTTVTHFTSQHFQTATYINGKRKEVTYTDGKLHIFFDLPSDIDPNSYAMKFEKDFLTLTFAKKEQTDPTKKVLEFNK